MMKYSGLLLKSLGCPLGIGIVLLAAGCGGKFDSRVSGKVTLDGKLLDSGIVTFHPNAKGPTAYGVIDNSGEYEVAIGHEAGLPSGDYLVTVVANEKPVEYTTGNGPPPPGRRLTPEHLSNKKTTDLHRTVDPGNSRYDLELSTP